MDVELLTGIAHACPSGAIRYRRRDGRPHETAPPVNLLSVREAGPYAVRGDLAIDGIDDVGYRATLCRCGASKTKPFCDGSHHEVKFEASGEPPTQASQSDMLAVRDGRLEINPTTAQLERPVQRSGTQRVPAWDEADRHRASGSRRVRGAALEVRRARTRRTTSRGARALSRQRRRPHHRAAAARAGRVERR